MDDQDKFDTSADKSMGETFEAGREYLIRARGLREVPKAESPFGKPYWIMVLDVMEGENATEEEFVISQGLYNKLKDPIEAGVRKFNILRIGR